MAQGTNSIKCLRCSTGLGFAGTRRFHEGEKWGALGNFAEAFVNRESFDVYVCPRCGHIEFFAEGVGEELRPPKGEA